MTVPGIHIVIIEPSQILHQGLKTILSDSGRNFHIIKAVDFTELQLRLARNQVDIVIINPSLVQMDVKIFQSIRNEQSDVKWIGLVYSFFDQQTLSMFDGIIPVNDFPHTIINTIQQVISQPKSTESTAESLSDRETEVLKLLVTGLANKEIADKLNISPHTVITHRKNISQKTGIKSVSGLTIYAVVKGMVNLDQFPG